MTQKRCWGSFVAALSTTEKIGGGQASVLVKAASSDEDLSRIRAALCTGFDVYSIPAVVLGFNFGVEFCLKA